MKLKGLFVYLNALKSEQLAEFKKIHTKSVFL